MSHGPTPHVPEPSAWPATLAAGMTLVAAGVVTNWIVSAAGIVVSLVAGAGWIALLLGERERSERGG